MWKYRGQIGLLVVAMIWGTGFVASAVAIEHYSPYQTLTLRFLLAFILMVVCFFKQLKSIRKSVIIKGIVLGIFLYLAFLFQTVGLAYTTPSKNAFLTAVNVILVPFIAFILFRQRISIQTILGTIFSVIGIAMLSLNSFGGFNFGDLLTLICAFCFSLQIIFTDHFVTDENPIQLTLVQMGTAAVIGLIVSLIRQENLWQNNMMGNLSILYLGAISTMLAFLIQTVSQKLTTSTEAAIILSTESVFGMLSSILLLHEIVTFKMVLGAMLILFGIILVEIRWTKKSGEHSL